MMLTKLSAGIYTVSLPSLTGRSSASAFLSVSVTYTYAFVVSAGRPEISAGQEAIETSGGVPGILLPEREDVFNKILFYLIPEQSFLLIRLRIRTQSEHKNGTYRQKQ